MLTGYVKAKEPGCILAEKTRGIIPQSTILRALHGAIGKLLRPTLDEYSKHHGLDQFVLGSGSGQQPLDILFPLSQCIEKGLDRGGRTAICQADIATFHDSIAWGATAKSLLSRGVQPGLVFAALRLHMHPPVRMITGNVISAVIPRSRGLLTGASTAGLLARMPTEDALAACRPLWQDKGFVVNESLKLQAMMWSDNVFTVGSSLNEASGMMADLADALFAVGGYSLKPSSKEALYSCTWTYTSYSVKLAGDEWTVKPHLRALGHVLSCTGHCGRCIQDTIGCLWRAFWANSKLLRCRRASLESRLRAWDIISAGILEYRCTRWPPTKTGFKIINSAQFKITCAIAALQPSSGETAGSFCVRRGRVLSTAIRHHSRLWSLRWAVRVQSWLEHCHRHPETLTAQLLRCQDSVWLMQRRHAFAHLCSRYSLLGGRTGTRSGAGKPVRWLDDSWTSHTVAANPARNRVRTLQQAEQWHAAIMG